MSRFSLIKSVIEPAVVFSRHEAANGRPYVVAVDEWSETPPGFKIRVTDRRTVWEAEGMRVKCIYKYLHVYIYICMYLCIIYRDIIQMSVILYFDAFTHIHPRICPDMPIRSNFRYLS